MTPPVLTLPELPSGVKLERHPHRTYTPPVSVFHALAEERAKTFLLGARIGATSLGMDCSHWQGAIDFKKVKAAGFVFVVLKATEGNGFVDPNFRMYRAQAHAAGLIVLIYHYVGSSSAKRVYDVNSELNHFIATVGTLTPGEGIALDYEPAAPPPDPVSWSKAWLDGARARLGASPWIYMNSSTESRYNWSPLTRDYGLWLAKYDNDPDMDAVVHWPGLAAEQYWDKATIPGVPGPVDIDVFYGTPAQLLLYCKGGASPIPTEDDMATLDAEDLKNIYEAVWFGAAGARLVPNYHAASDGSRGEWPYTTLGWLEDRIGQEILAPQVAALQGELAGLAAALKQLAAAPGQTVDLDAVREAAKEGAASAIKAIDVTVETT